MEKAWAIDHEIQQNNRVRDHIIVYLGWGFSCGVSHPYSERGHTSSSRYGDTRRCSNHCWRT
jgi:hypothetical protein